MTVCKWRAQEIKEIAVKCQWKHGDCWFWLSVVLVVAIPKVEAILVIQMTHSTEYIPVITYCRDMEWQKLGLCWRCAWRLQRLHSRWSPGHAAQWFGMRRWKLLTPRLVYRCPTTSLARFAFEDPKSWKVICHTSRFEIFEGFEDISSKNSVACNLPDYYLLV